MVESAFVTAGKTKEIKNAGRPDAKRNMLKLLQKQQRAGELDRPKKSYAKKPTAKKSA